ncbi:MAG: protein-disulfide reductase DsbD [Pseudomonadales bacterium]|nr:protein-disulfide reductase DsbD [Pseudomonadales bacterium]
MKATSSNKITKRATSHLQRLMMLICAAMFLTNVAIAESLFSGSSDSALGGGSQQDDFLPAEQAFQMSSNAKDDALHFRWTMADGYYLYKHRFQFKVESPEGAILGEPLFSKQGKPKKDPTFGDVEAFYHDIDIMIPVDRLPSSPLTVKVRYQGCADAGLCYLPQKETLSFELAPISKVDSQNTNNNAGNQSNENQQSSATNELKKNSTDTESATGLASVLAEKSFLFNLGLFFILGVGLCFTPCVLPMVPILSSIIVGQGKNTSTFKGFMLSSTYVLGMASTYAVAGMAVGVSGEQVQVVLQQPVVLFSFAGVFVILSLSMFGFYELQLPNSFQSKLNSISQKQQGGTLMSAAVMGMLAALIASPCVSAPLMGALLYIGQTGDMWFGGAALLALGLGMGTPLIALGTTGANVLPKAGPWMDKVKAIFGILLLATGVWLTKHLIPDTIESVLWGFLLVLAGLYLGAFEHHESSKHQLFRGLAITALVAGAALTFNGIAAPTGNYSTAEASSTAKHLPFETLRSSEELDAALAESSARGQPVMLDYFAEWCIACIEMEHTSFSDPTAQQLLSGHRWLQLDLTNNDEAKALLDRYNLVGPPAILFFDQQGQEIKDARIYAYKAPEPFISHLQQLQ